MRARSFTRESAAKVAARRLARRGGGRSAPALSTTRHLASPSSPGTGDTMSAMEPLMHILTDGNTGALSAPLSLPSSAVDDDGELTPLDTLAQACHPTRCTSTSAFASLPPLLTPAERATDAELTLSTSLPPLPSPPLAEARGSRPSSSCRSASASPASSSSVGSGGTRSSRYCTRRGRCSKVRLVVVSSMRHRARRLRAYRRRRGRRWPA